MSTWTLREGNFEILDHRGLPVEGRCGQGGHQIECRVEEVIILGEP